MEVERTPRIEKRVKDEHSLREEGISVNVERRMSFERPVSNKNDPQNKKVVCLTVDIPKRTISLERKKVYRRTSTKVTTLETQK